METAARFDLKFRDRATAPARRIQRSMRKLARALKQTGTTLSERTGRTTAQQRTQRCRTCWGSGVIWRWQPGLGEFRSNPCGCGR